MASKELTSASKNLVATESDLAVAKSGAAARSRPGVRRIWLHLKIRG